jgi:cytochrome c553
MPIQRFNLLLGLIITMFSMAQAIAEPAHYNASTNYILRCAGCHAMDGTGSKNGGIPPLQLIKTFTSDAKGRAYLMHVPGVVSTGLNSKEIAEVINYVADRWGDKSISYTPFTEQEVAELRSEKIPDIVSYRREITEKYKAEGKTVADYPWP